MSLKIEDLSAGKLTVESGASLLLQCVEGLQVLDGDTLIFVGDGPVVRVRMLLPDGRRYPVAWLLSLGRRRTHLHRQGLATRALCLPPRGTAVDDDPLVILLYCDLYLVIEFGVAVQEFLQMRMPGTIELRSDGLLGID